MTGIFADFFYYTNDISNALRQKREALELARRMSSERETGLLADLGLFEYVAGNIDQAIEYTKASLDRSYSRSGSNYTGNNLCQLADIFISKGSFSEARKHLEEAFSYLIEHQNYPARTCLKSWATLAGVEGYLAEAAQLIGFSEAQLERLEETIDPFEVPNYNRLMAILRAGLSPAEYDALKARGAEWSEAEAIAFVSSQLLEIRGRPRSDI